MALLTTVLLTTVLLTMALLTMALLTMALPTMALPTMALLTMALLTWLSSEAGGRPPTAMGASLFIRLISGCRIVARRACSKRPLGGGTARQTDTPGARLLHAPGRGARPAQPRPHGALPPNPHMAGACGDTDPGALRPGRCRAPCYLLITPRCPPPSPRPLRESASQTTARTMTPTPASTSR